MEKIKLLPLDLKCIEEVWSFLKPQEAYCVQLCERLEEFVDKGKSNGNFICFVEKQLLGVIFVSNAGMVLHSLGEFSDDQRLVVKKLLGDYFANRKVYCISGKKTGTTLICEAIISSKNTRPVEIRDYNLMIFDSKFKNNIFFPVKKCNLEDLDKLLFIQSEYDKIEVLPATYSFDEKLCKKKLFFSLQKERVFAIDIGSENFVAKASINAKSSRYTQIGGVYTDNTYRGKGYAATLVNYIATNASNIGQRVVLFVRKDNIPAIRSYTKAGFKSQDSYGIVYF